MQRVQKNFRLPKGFPSMGFWLLEGRRNDGQRRTCRLIFIICEIDEIFGREFVVDGGL